MAWIRSNGSVEISVAEIQDARDEAFDRAEQLAAKIALVEQADARGAPARRMRAARRELDDALNEVAACDLALAKRYARRGQIGPLLERLDLLADTFGLPDVLDRIADQAVQERNSALSEAHARADVMAKILPPPRLGPS